MLKFLFLLYGGVILIVSTIANLNAMQQQPASSRNWSSHSGSSHSSGGGGFSSGGFGHK